MKCVKVIQNIIRIISVVFMYFSMCAIAASGFFEVQDAVQYEVGRKGKNSITYKIQPIILAIIGA